MEHLPVALSGSAASIISWPNWPADIALGPAHRIGGVVTLVVARVVHAARTCSTCAGPRSSTTSTSSPANPYSPASRLNRRPDGSPALSNLRSRVGVDPSGARQWTGRFADRWPAHA
jgi:hypothetical protein